MQEFVSRVFESLKFEEKNPLPNHGMRQIFFTRAFIFLYRPLHSVDERNEQMRLHELKEWLLKCNYPEKLSDKKFHCPKLQGPANQAKTEDSVIPLV